MESSIDDKNANFFQSHGVQSMETTRIVLFSIFSNDLPKLILFSGTAHCSWGFLPIFPPSGLFNTFNKMMTGSLYILSVFISAGDSE